MRSMSACARETWSSHAQRDVAARLAADRHRGPGIGQRHDPLAVLVVAHEEERGAEALGFDALGQLAGDDWCNARTAIRMNLR